MGKLTISTFLGTSVAPKTISTTAGIALFPGNIANENMGRRISIFSIPAYPTSKFLREVIATAQDISVSQPTLMPGIWNEHGTEYISWPLSEKTSTEPFSSASDSTRQSDFVREKDEIQASDTSTTYASIQSPVPTVVVAAMEQPSKNQQDGSSIYDGFPETLFCFAMGLVIMAAILTGIWTWYWAVRLRKHRQKKIQQQEEYVMKKEMAVDGGV